MGYSDATNDTASTLFLWNAPAGIDLNLRYSCRSCAACSITATGAVATPQDRIN
jgi:hypothetical protein